MPAYPQSIIGSILGPIWKLITWPFRMIWKIVRWLISSIIHLILLVYRGITCLLFALRKIFEIYHDNMRWSIQFMWVGCVILLLGLTMLLFVLSPFYAVPLIGSDLVLKSRTTYTLSSESFRALNAKVRAKEFPHELYKSLKKLENKAVKGEKEFLAAVAEHAGEGYAQQYQALILENALTSYILTDHSFNGLYENVPDDIVRSLFPLKDRQPLGEDAFLKKVQERIGADLVREYEELFLTYGRNQSSPPRYVLNARSFNALRNVRVPHELLQMLAPLQEKEIAGKANFIGSVQTQLGRSVLQRYQELFLSSAHLGTYMLNGRSLAYLQLEEFDDELLMKLRPLTEQVIDDGKTKKKFLEDVKKAIGRELSDEERELLLRYAAQFSLTEGAFEKLRCAEVPGYILKHVENSDLRDREILGEVDFLAQVKQVLEVGLIESYKSDFLIYARHAGFTLTEKSFEALKQRQVPEKLIVKLVPLKNAEIPREDILRKKLRQYLGAEDSGTYQDAILEEASNERFILTYWDLEALKGTGGREWRPLEGRTFVGRDSLLESLPIHLGEQGAQKYEALIRQYVQISLNQDLLDRFLEAIGDDNALLLTLQELTEKKFIGEERFLVEVEKLIGRKNSEIHREFLLNHIVSYSLTKAQELDVLKRADERQWQRLIERRFTGRKSLLKSLQERFGEQSVKEHEALIRRHVQISLNQDQLDRFLETVQDEKDHLTELEELTEAKFIGERDFLGEVLGRIEQGRRVEYSEYLLDKFAFFSLTDKTFLLLNEWVEKVPTKVVRDLDPLKDREIARQEVFLQQLKKSIGENETEKYGSIISQRASNWSFTLSDWDFDALRGIDGLRWQALEERAFNGKDNFLHELRFQLGEHDAERFEHAILQHVRISLPKIDKFPMALRVEEQLSTKLAELQGREFVGEENFLAVIQEQIGEEDSEKHYTQILNTAVFSLTEESFLDLAQVIKRVPEDVLSILKILKNEEILGEYTFLTSLKERIGDKKTGQYEEPILQHALNVNYTLSEESFKGLGDIAERLRPLKNIEIFSKDKFVGAITQLLGEAEMQEYEHQSRILQHVEISFSVNEPMLKYFKDKKLPDEGFIESLRTLKPIEVVGENAFIRIVLDCIGQKEKVEIYRNYLLNESFFTLTESSLQSLKKDASLRKVPENVWKAMQILKNQDIHEGEDGFLAKLSTILGEKDTQKYKKPILEEAEKTHPVLRFDLPAALTLIGNSVATTEFLFIVSCLALFIGLALLASLSVTLTSFAISLWEFINEVSSSRLILVMMFVVAMSVLLVLALLKGYIVL